MRPKMLQAIENCPTNVGIPSSLFPPRKYLLLRDDIGAFRKLKKGRQAELVRQ